MNFRAAYTMDDLLKDIISKNKLNIVELYRLIDENPTKDDLDKVNALIGSYQVDDTNGALDDSISVIANLVVVKQNLTSTLNRIKSLEENKEEKGIAKQLADSAQAAAIAAAALDATAKANAAQAAATAAASLDATSKANAAQAAAISAAATDAANKAAKALTDAKAYTDNEISKIPQPGTAKFKDGSETIEQTGVGFSKQETKDEIAKENPLLKDYEMVHKFTTKGQQFQLNLNKPNDFILLTESNDSNTNERIQKFSVVNRTQFLEIIVKNATISVNVEITSSGMATEKSLSYTSDSEIYQRKVV